MAEMDTTVMSFSNPTIVNPAQKLFQWKGGEKGGGKLVWYDKESKENIAVTLPFRFIVLDELVTIKGFSQTYEGGIWSNEIRNIKKDTLTVKVKNMDIASGKYDAIKNDIKAAGGKFAASVYIAYQAPGGEWAMGNISFYGASLGAWFDFRKSASLQVEGGLFTGAEKDSKGATTFFVPTFGIWKFAPSDIEAGIRLDKELQKFLETYLERKEMPTVEIEDTDIVIETPEEKDQFTKEVSAVEEVLGGNVMDKEIDLSEIPF